MLKLGTVALVAFFSLSPPVGQDVAALKREIEQLKAQQAAMQKDLDAIKSFLQQLLRAPQDNKLVDAAVPIAGRPTRGSASAKITLVEISDYHCPFCRRHSQQTQPQIDAEYVNAGKIQYVFIDYPIAQLHPDAFKSHEAANCASDQGKYWEMHNRLFASPTKEPAQLVSHAQELGLDAAKLKACLDNGKYAKAVRDTAHESREGGQGRDAVRGIQEGNRWRADPVGSARRSIAKQQGIAYRARSLHLPGTNGVAESWPPNASLQRPGIDAPQSGQLPVDVTRYDRT
jgi:protein-disulfide isomerase